MHMVTVSTVLLNVYFMKFCTVGEKGILIVHDIYENSLHC